MEKEMFLSIIHISINKRDPTQHIYQTDQTGLLNVCVQNFIFDLILISFKDIVNTGN